MTSKWTISALAALGGAVLATAIVFGAAALGLFPRQALDGRQVHDYLLHHPQILAEMSGRLQEQEAAAEDQAERDRQTAVSKASLKAFFDPAVAYVTGPANARASVVEFFDYNCVHCRNTFPAVQAFYESHKNDTRFAFIDFPIFGKMSDAAARAAVAARRQGDKYIAFSFAMMSEKGAIDTDTMYADAKAAGLDIPKLIADMNDPAIDKVIAASHALARRLNFDGTPTFVVNGKVHSGEIEAATLEQMTRG
ncbi:MAG TPA: thioredoxin domain-containing protein [Rhizomicrobium sp.]